MKSRVAGWILAVIDALLRYLSSILKDPSLPFPAQAKEDISSRFAAMREELGRLAARLKKGK